MAEISRRTERRGTRMLLLWAAVASVLLLAAVTVWPIVTGGRPIGGDATTQGQQASR
jgi:hypothetical protein